MNTGLDNLDILELDRRTFLKAVGMLGASAFLGNYGTQIARALKVAETKVVWLNGAACTGCSMSFINSAHPDVVQAITELNVNIGYMETLSPQQGIFVDGAPAGTSELNSELKIEELVREGGYILVVEGAVPFGGSGRYLTIAGKPFKDILKQVAGKASAVVAMGACSSFGGVPSARSDIRKDTDYRGLLFTGTEKKGAFSELGIDKPVINLAGCPPNPEFGLITLGALILGKITPADLPDILDRYNRPTVFFPPDHTIHENCPRRGYYDKGQLDTEFSGEHCLWKLGCKGPYTHSDCATRRWNNALSMCTKAGSPCIGCMEPGFPDSFSPFYRESEGVGILLGADANTIAKVAIGAAAVGVGAHAVRRVMVSMKKHDAEPEKAEEAQE